MKEADLLGGLDDEVRRKAETHLTRLVPHLKPDRFAVVGGLAVNFLAVLGGVAFRRGEFNDLDLVITEAGAVLPTIVNDFMIAHHHFDENDKSLEYFALVDRESRTKSDIFPNFPPRKSFVRAKVGDFSINVSTAEDQLVKTVQDLQNFSERRPADSKFYSHLKLLREIADFNKASGIWEELAKKDYPRTLKEAIDGADRKAEEHPDWLRDSSFKKLKPDKCEECVVTIDYPLTPLEEVYKVLGD